MDYNKGYEIDFKGYDKETGCIAFPENEWSEWYHYFVNNEPARFYAYIMRREDNAYIGDVNVHRSAKNPWYDMGIVIEAKYRGNGYAVEAIRLLEKQAFEVMGADAIHNDFEDVRDAAVKTHLSAGFSEYKRKNGLLELMLTREQYFVK